METSYRQMRPRTKDFEAETSLLINLPVASLQASETWKLFGSCCVCERRLSDQKSSVLQVRRQDFPITISVSLRSQLLPFSGISRFQAYIFGIFVAIRKTKYPLPSELSLGIVRHAQLLKFLRRCIFHQNVSGGQDENICEILAKTFPSHALWPAHCSKKSSYN